MDDAHLSTDACEMGLAAARWLIHGGANEIQRNILGERVLGLPR